MIRRRFFKFKQTAVNFRQQHRSLCELISSTLVSLYQYQVALHRRMVTSFCTLHCEA